MPSRIRQITFDCRDPHVLARFWADALGFVEDPENPNHPDDPEARLVDPTGLHPALLFLPVPEEKVVKNRLHVDLQPDQARDAEVERVLGLGATLVADHRTPDGLGWAVLADPEGNELCVERSAAERGAPAPRDTGERPWTQPLVGDERSTLVAMLEWYREGVVAKVDGTTPAVAAARPLRSATSIAGLVHHLALVEDRWFHYRFAGHEMTEPWASAPWEQNPDWDFTVAETLPLDDIVARYRAACERSRAVVAGRDLDERGVHPFGGEPFDLRFALVHVIEETARHLGHLDILRELLDGTTGE